jgi:hypothetical protein
VAHRRRDCRGGRRRLRGQVGGFIKDVYQGKGRLNVRLLGHAGAADLLVTTNYSPPIAELSIAAYLAASLPPTLAASRFVRTSAVKSRPPARPLATPRHTVAAPRRAPSPAHRDVVADALELRGAGLQRGNLRAQPHEALGQHPGGGLVVALCGRLDLADQLVLLSLQGQQLAVDLCTCGRVACRRGTGASKSSSRVARGNHVCAFEGYKDDGAPPVKAEAERPIQRCASKLLL